MCAYVVICLLDFFPWNNLEICIISASSLLTDRKSVHNLIVREVIRITNLISYANHITKIKKTMPKDISRV